RITLARRAHNASTGAFNPYRLSPADPAPFAAGELGGDGLPNATQLPPPGSTKARNLRKDLATQFALYHHQPQPEKFAPSNPDKVLDFHKAITALQAYPAMLRALGLVSDLDLPTSFLPLTSVAAYKRFGVASAARGWIWATQPKPVPTAMTAYHYLDLSGHKLFMTAPSHGLNPPDPSGQ